MGTTTTLVTVQEFLALPEIEGQRIELIGGEVVSMGRGGAGHELVKANLIELLVDWTKQNQSYKLLSETTFQLDQHNSPIPDVSLLSRSRIPSDMSGWFQGAPDVAMEVVSSEKAALLEKQIELYLAHGSKSVWVVYPEQRVVWIYDVSGNAKKFEQNQKLEDPAVLPGFSTPVSAIFEGI
ncbi:MAG TPA: Uma2 family endonuclease [Bryobacteraceae bacterium]|nr:Uma2 family endonuclease [Bryobacteraceae bacterium]